MVLIDKQEYITQEEKRLQEDRERTRYWKKWGPYVAERQWATGKSWEEGFFGSGHWAWSAGRADCGLMTSSIRGNSARGLFVSDTVGKKKQSRRRNYFSPQPALNWV